MIASSIANLVLEVLANENLIVIKCSPGSAQLIARFLDFQRCQILGTIAGDDAIFVAPVSIKSIDETYVQVKNCLFYED